MFYLSLARCCDSSLSIVTSLRAGQQRHRDSICDRSRVPRPTNVTYFAGEISSVEVTNVLRCSCFHSAVPLPPWPIRFAGFPLKNYLTLRQNILYMINISRYTKPRSPFRNRMENRRMATIVARILYLSRAICWQERELVFSVCTLDVSRNNYFYTLPSLPSLIQPLHLPSTIYINFLSLPILHFLPWSALLHAHCWTSTAMAWMAHNHGEAWGI